VILFLGTTAAAAATVRKQWFVVGILKAKVLGKRFSFAVTLLEKGLLCHHWNETGARRGKDEENREKCGAVMLFPYIYNMGKLQ
jgi:hypothetical protein